MIKRGIVILIISLSALYSHADDIIFDHDSLKYKGISDDIAKLYGKKARFQSGNSTVSLFINDNYIGKKKLNFNDEGELCLNKQFIQVTHIQLSHINKDCELSKNQEHQEHIEIELIPENLRVNIFVSPELLEAEQNNNWLHTGKSGLLNYNMKYFSSSNKQQNQSFFNSNFILGANIYNWMLRSNQNYTYNNGQSSFQHQTLYGEKTLERFKKNMQIGQINLSNTFSSSGQVIGVQFTPESSLIDQFQGGAEISGIATSRSIIEVRQAGILIYSTTVPEGPYTLENLPLLNSRSDLLVTETDQEGTKREFTVTASAFMLSNNRMNKEVTFGFGKVNQRDVDKKPFVVNISKGFNLRSNMAVDTGALFSKDHQSIGISNHYQATNNSLFSLSSHFSHDKEANNGLYSSLSYGYSINNKIGLITNIAYRDKDYREFTETLTHYDNDKNHSIHNETQYGIGINATTDNFGSFSLSWDRAESDRRTDYFNMTWDRLFYKKYNVYLSADRRVYNNRKENTFYLNIDISLDNKQHLSSWVTHYGENKTYGARYSNYQYDDFNYSINASGNTHPRNKNLSLNTSYKTSKTMLSGSVSKSEHSHSYYGSLSGGMAFYDNHLILSPQNIGKNFAIVNTHKKPNIPIETPSGTVFTNNQGYAVIANIEGYRKNHAQIDYQKLPKDIDIPYGIIEFSPANGSVPLIDFHVQKVNRAILMADFNGQKLPKNKNVYDENGELLTLTDSAGRIIIDNLILPLHYTVKIDKKHAVLFVLMMLLNQRKISYLLE